MHDYHMHTVYSDGVLSVSDLISAVNSSNLHSFSITDHESVDAYFDPSLSDLCLSKRLIPGVELTVWYNGFELDLLCYNIDAFQLRKSYFMQKSYIDSRKYIRYQRMCDRARSLGLHIRNLCSAEFFELLLEYRSISRIFLLETMTLENSWYYDRFTALGERLFFRSLSKPGGDFNIDYSDLYPSITEILDIVHGMGGVVILAHPYVYGISDLPGFVSGVLDHGVDGVEVFYPKGSSVERSVVYSLVSERNKLMTCGSDYHYGDVTSILGSTYNPLCQISL